MTPRLVLEKNCLATCRETIEWNYGNIGSMWAYLGYKKVLKLRSMPVGQICDYMAIVVGDVTIWWAMGCVEN